MKNKFIVFLLLILSVRAYGQCTLNATLTTPNPVVCSGSPINLTITPSAGTPPYNYAWSTGETGQIISVNKSGTYTVTVTDAQNCVVVKNINITTGNTPTPPDVDDALACPGSTATLRAKGPGGFYQWYDANGIFKASGDTFVTPPITTQTVFFVETTVNGCTSTRTQVTVFPINPPYVSGGYSCPGSAVRLSAGGAADYEWYDGPVKVGTGPLFITPPLSASKTYYVVGITAGCVSTRVPVEATILTPPDAPTIVGPTSTCSNTSVTLSATAPANAKFEWFTQASGGTPVISSPVYTTPILNSNTRYYVQAIVGDCVSARTMVEILVNPKPNAPIVTSVAPTCVGTQAAMAVSAPIPGANYRWYATNTSTTVLNATSTYSPIVTTSAVFYVEVEVNGCTSLRTAVPVTVNPAPLAPTVNSVAPICDGQTATITVSSTGGTYNWFTNDTGGLPLITNSATFTTPPLNTTTRYYVETVANGCSSPRTEVTVTVTPKPLPPIVTGNTPICRGDGLTLIANGTGTSYEWYDAATGGNLLASGSAFSTGAVLVNRSYFVQTSSNGCSSDRTQVDVTVNPKPTTPSVSPVPPLCAGNSATLTASGTATLRWFNVASGGAPLATGTSFVTPALTANTSYWVDSYDGTCASDRVRINITISSTANQFNFASAVYCKSSPDPSPLITVTGGTFSGPAGLIIDATTGVINIAATTPGIYDITYTNGCTISTEKVGIVTVPDATFTYASAVYCQSQPNPSPVFAPTALADRFTATPAGLVFRSTRSGVIDLSASVPGTYTITNTIDIGSGCPQVQSSFVVKIDEQVIVSAGPDQVAAQGEDVQLAGSITGAVSTGTWSTSGSGSFLPNNSTLNATYRPGAGENGPVTLTLLSSNPPGGSACGAVANTVIITLNPKPAAPTFTGITALCANNNTTLTATGPAADSYKWYTVANAGTAVFTGANFTTPLLNTAGVTTYYLEATLNGVPSARTAVNITVTAKPSAPTTNAIVETCYGSAATLTATSTVAGGIIEWYTAPSGGTAIFTGPVFTTPGLIANTTYYVQVADGNCQSDRAKIDIVMKPLPHITSAPTAETCSGAVNYDIKADLSGTTFSWSRVSRPEISNPDLINQTNTNITETLVNTTGATVDVTYRITPTSNGCTGPVFDYVVKVFATPKVVSLPPAPVCSKELYPNGFYTILFNTPITDVSWSRAAVTGIRNPAVTNQRSPTLYENLENTTTLPIDVVYVFTFNTPDCLTPSTYTLTVTVNPKVTINSPDNGGEICSGSPVDYEIRSDVPTANFIWTRRDDPRITPAPAPTTANRITETLTNTSGGYVDVFYDIAATTGCQTPFTYKATLKPQPAQPEAFTNAPVCVGSTLYLIPGLIERGSTYHWTGPNGFSSNDALGFISNVTTAARGVYTLYVTRNGCTSIGGQTLFADIHEKHIANAGGTQLACINATSIQLNGAISGGSSSGQWSRGTGTGDFPDPANLTGLYIPSASDRAAGQITLILTSTGQDDCARASDILTIKFTKLPGTDAGPDKTVCNQNNAIPLDGKMIMAGNGKWTSSSSGSAGFSSNVQINGAAGPTYTPNAADIAAGKVTLTLTADNTADECYLPADEVVITLEPPIKISAGPTKYLLEGNTTTLTPTVNDAKAKYTWSPAVGLNNPTLKNPIVTGDITRVYTLVVQDSLGCITEPSKVQVIVSPKIEISNAFTPNNDGINDTWDLTGLVAYPNAVVDVFDRNGQQVFHTIGYSKPWDGSFKGRMLPSGTYYYIIDAKMYGYKYSGYLSIVK